MLIYRHASIVWLRTMATCAVSIGALAQQPRTPEMPPPPPMRFVSRVERAQLDGARDAKARLRQTIALADDHLKRGEQDTEQKRFDDAQVELGSYLGLIGDLRAFLGTMGRDEGSTRDLYKHLEIAIRPHLPRIAVMRRDTPAIYIANLKDAEEYIKDTRAEALDSFYGQTVLREGRVPERNPAPQATASPEPLKHP